MTDAIELGEQAVVRPTFAGFYAEHYRRAVGLAWALTGSRETAEELVQDAVQFWLESFDGQSAPIDPTTVDPGVDPAVPAVGERLDGGFWPVPPSTQTLTITLDDGTTIEPQLVDVRPTGDAKLAIIPASARDHRVEAVSST